MTKLVKVLRFFFILFMIVAVVFFVFIYNVTVPCSAQGKKHLFTIKEGQTARNIAAELQKDRLIRSGLTFLVLVRISGDESRIKAGEYELSPQLSALQILEKFVRGDVLKRGFTVPEGSRLTTIAKILEQEHIVRSEDFLAIATGNKRITIGELCPVNLEGFLFPDTYQTPSTVTPAEVVEMMVKRFEEVIMPACRSASSEADLISVVTMASLVENEAKLDTERPVIAAVYYNRIRKGMALQCDATIQYILGNTKPYLDYSDLKIESPYNTYLYPGLPPGPICNPGLKSVEAALRPAQVDYLYYVLNDKKGDGSHVFSATYEDHVRAIKNYQKQ